MFFKIGFLKNLAIFTGTNLYLSLFLIKLQASRSSTLLKGILNNTFLYRTPPVAVFEYQLVRVSFFFLNPDYDPVNIRNVSELQKSFPNLLSI